MLCKVTARLGLDESYQITHFNKELVLRPFFRGERARIVFRCQFFHMSRRGLIRAERENLSRCSGGQTTAQGLNDAPEQSYRSAFRSHKQIRIKAASFCNNK